MPIQFLMRALVFLMYGLVWLFIFSIPVGRATNLFHVGYYYIVDTRPIHMITGFMREGASKTTGAATGAAHNMIDKVEEKGRVVDLEN